MAITAVSIASSISNAGVRLDTLQVRFPKFILAEFNTHRVFSRNASSSRAIPVERMIEDILADTVIPKHWGKNKPGMQADEENEESVYYEFEDSFAFLSREAAWLQARDNAIVLARAFHQAGYHKQIVNRLIETFSYVNVLVTSTEWANFFELRRHKDAQPEMKILADTMYEAIINSEPKELKSGEWHLPYINEDDGHIDLETLVKMSIARCARVSYLTTDGRKSTTEKDLQLYDRLLSSNPIHASPSEHQASPDSTIRINSTCEWRQRHLHGNLRGWIQARKLIENNKLSDFLRNQGINAVNDNNKKTER